MMQETTHNTLDAAIQAAKEIERQKRNSVIDFEKFMIVPEIYETTDGFTVVMKDSLTEIRSEVGELLGYYDGRFRPVEEVRAEIKRDEAIEAKDDEAMARRRY